MMNETIFKQIISDIEGIAAGSDLETSEMGITFVLIDHRTITVGYEYINVGAGYVRIWFDDSFEFIPYSSIVSIKF